MSICKLGKLSIGLVLISFGIGCAPVRLIEENDPKIEQGMTAYQEALEVFVNQTLANYELCESHQGNFGSLSEMVCTDDDPDVESLCNAEIETERLRAEEQAESSCRQASYEENRKSFYITHAAKLSVLKTRANVLDSMGICVRAMSGISKAAVGVVPAEIRDAIDVDAAQEAKNCTEIIVNTVLENHKAMGLNHRCIDNPGPEPCPVQYRNIDLTTWDSAVQAQFYFPTQLDTLLQNIRIVLFLEEAKKRGVTSEGG